MPRAQNIDEVLAQLAGMIDWARRNDSRLGYFQALYRQVTAAVKRGISEGAFEDGPRMERLDVIFANRYFDAFDRWRGQGGPTLSWQLAFAAAEKWRPIVLQHLLVGVNAHINLDLGVAAAEVAPGPALGALRHDFMKINDVLASLVGGVQREMERIWPALRLLDRVGGRSEDAIVNFSLTKARDHAWSVAERLVAAGPSGEDKQVAIAEVDAWTANFGHVIMRLPLLVRMALLWVRVHERGGVARNIEVLVG